jgi:hypothetical protein
MLHAAQYLEGGGAYFRRDSIISDVYDAIFRRVSKIAWRRSRRQVRPLPGTAIVTVNRRPNPSWPGHDGKGSAEAKFMLFETEPRKGNAVSIFPQGKNRKYMI